MPAVSNRSPRAVGAAGARPPLRLALVNNMPPSARAETARDLVGLMTHEPMGLEVSHYELTGPEVDRVIDDQPDLLIVTGSEPRADRLEEEEYWSDLARLLRWAPGATRSVFLSCLTAHAYLLLADGIERVRLPVKCHGVFDNRVRSGAGLTAGLPPQVRIPHSRSNEAPSAAVEAEGWEIQLGADDVGWTIASRREGDCTVVLAQGHPEYGTETLLREHRRDTRRWVQGERDAFPPLPVAYLGPDGVAALCAYRTIVEQGGSTDGVPYPFTDAARGIVNDWTAPSRRLAANWVAEAGRGAPRRIRR